MIEPEDLAQRLVRCIRENNLYLVSHPETQPSVEARFAGILDAYNRIPAS